MADPGSGDRLDGAPAGPSGGQGDPARPAAQSALQRVSYLDQALWKKLDEADEPEVFSRYWLALQCRMVSGTVRGQVALDITGRGILDPIAQWPDGDPGAEGLINAANRATDEKRGVVYGHREGRREADATCFAAYPLIVDGALRGVVSVEIADRSENDLRAVMRQLQWGVVWVEVFLRRQKAQTENDFREKTLTTLDLVAAAVEGENFNAAALAVVTEMAMRLDCDRVSAGFVSRGHTRVAAVSHTARFGKRMNLIRAVGSAMDEAIDQRSAMIFPDPGDDGLRITTAHAELSRANNGATVLTIPFADQDRYLGAMTFEFPEDHPLDQTSVDLLDGLVSAIGPILWIKRREDRLLITKALDSFRMHAQRLVGPKRYGYKLAAILLLAVAAFSIFVTDQYRVTADARLDALVRRVVVAPFDGYIVTEHARAGDPVQGEQLLAELDIHDLSLERLRRVSTRAQRVAEYNRALAQRDAANINVVRAQIEQVDAEIRLLDEQIGRSKIRAPFDGVVVAGDLSQAVGSSVQRGNVLFEVAPLNAYRVILNVEDRLVRDIAVGQTGSILMASIPDEPMPITISSITPVSEARDGQNFFRVEAKLDRMSDRLRPGMEGVAKVSIDERRLVWIWTHSFVDWVRIQFWSLWP